MAFGQVMRLAVGDLNIELAPLTKEVMGEFVAGMSQGSITKYLPRDSAPTLEDEIEWYDRVRAEKDSLIWGIWVIDGKQRILIGNTSLFHITKTHIHQATSGSLIFRKEYWGKGIASHIHKARTWYAFEQLGLHRVMSAVIQGNVASFKALAKSGYEVVYVERNTTLVDGSLKHQDNLECLNPLESFWTQWWHGDRPSQRLQAARTRTAAVMAWAQDNVELL